MKREVEEKTKNSLKLRMEKWFTHFTPSGVILVNVLDIFLFFP